MKVLRKHFPILTRGAESFRQTIGNDLIVAETVAVRLIPQSPAHALSVYENHNTHHHEIH